jgi:outer membrane protein, heavy metal efflux system
MIPKLSCVVFVLAALGVAQTQLSLEQAIRTAQQRPELRSANQRVEAAEQVRRQSGLFPNPRLFLQLENIRSSNFDYGRDADTYAFFTQMLETSGRRGGRLAVASEEVDRRQLEREHLRREIGFRVRDAYWNASAAQFANELYNQSDAYFKQILDYHEARFREGKLAEVDLLRVRLQAEQMRAAAANARLRLDQAQLDLARAMGVIHPSPWELTEKFDELETPHAVPGNADVTSSRVEGRLAQQDVKLAEAQWKLERAKGRPDLDALFGYKRTLGFNTAMAGLQLNIPLFDRNQGASAAAQANVKAAESALDGTRIQLNLEASLARRAYESRLQQVKDIFGPLRERAIEIADISRLAYKESGLDLLRLLDAERLRIDSQLAWVDALTQYHASVTELERAEGAEP